MKKITAALLLTVSAFSYAKKAPSHKATTPAVAPITHDFTDIMEMHLASLPLPGPAAEPEKQKIGGLEVVKFKAAKVVPYDEILLSYNLVGPHLKKSGEKITNKNVWKDLEYFCGGGAKEINVLSLLKRTSLPEGDVALAYLLSDPISNVQQLQARQQLIRAIAQDTHLTASLHKQLSHIKNHHTGIATFWASAAGSMNTAVEKTQYWDEGQGKWLNTSFAYQHFMYPFKNLYQLIFPVMCALMSGVTVMEPSLLHDPNILFALIVSPVIYWSSYLQLRVDYEMVQYLHTQANGIAALVTSVEKIEKIIAKHPEFNTLQHRTTFKNFGKNRKALSQKLRGLITLLKKDTFKGKPSFFSLKARAKVAYAMIQEIKNELTPALAAVGELDAYLSCAKLYKEFEGKENGFVFAQYLEKDTPTIVMEGMWNPFIGSDKSIVNSVEIGTHFPRNIILTGPNAGGKSTFTKGLTLNVLLAQTIGIVPARSFSLTPFSIISTYMNISDDTAGGNSLFKAEVLRAQALMESIHTLSAGTFAFSVMDEMFSGTSPKEGEAASYAVAENLGSHPQSILVLATHFPELKKLEATSGAFKNYQVRVIRHEDGTFSYPFKLEFGAADQNVALDILQQQGFAGSILEKAQEILAKKNK